MFEKKLTTHLIEIISPAQRKIILTVGDATLTFASFAIALSFIDSQAAIVEYGWFILALVFVRHIMFRFYGFYNFLWRYASLDSIVALVKAVTIGSLITVAFLPLKSLVILEWAFTLILVGGSRVALRLYRDHLMSSPDSEQTDKINVLIVGAGDAGDLIAREISKKSSLNYRLVGFVDDKPNKLGHMIHQAPILGRTMDIPHLVDLHTVHEVVIAIPSAQGKDIRRIVTLCESAKVKFRITPGLYDIISGSVSLNQIREVRIEDLLGRSVVQTDPQSISDYLANSVVMVTGAAGSIGSELCRQIFRYSPKQLLLLDNNENGVYEIEMDLSNQKSTGTQLVPLVADVKDSFRLERIFSEYRPQIVFHAAAYKHVPLMEFNASEVVLNNIVGTQHVLELSDKYETKKFVLISSDKAVNPANCMGASKRICEVLMQVMAEQSQTTFAAVRFGNVLGSNGSVIPLFKKQIASGGPITVTHPDMTRFFMTIPEAVGLVIQTGSLSQGGEIFVLDMGDPVKIVNLAKDMIHLSGLEAGKDIEIKFIGLRPGEKIHEELFFQREALQVTSNKKIFIAEPTVHNRFEVLHDISELAELSQNAAQDIVKKRVLEIASKPYPVTRVPVS